MNSTMRSLAILTAFLGLTACARAASPVQPRLDPFDNQMWRGDQFSTVADYPEVNGVQPVRDLRWGFVQQPSGKWGVNLARATIDVRTAHRITLYMSPFEPRKVASH